MEQSEYREVAVGSLRFEVQKIHGHERGDLYMFLDKNVSENAAAGTDSVGWIDWRHYCLRRRKVGGKGHNIP